MGERVILLQRLATIQRVNSSDPEEDVEIETPLTKEQATYNKQHKRLRARVESVFGSVKNRFATLRVPFKESPEQLCYLVYFAFGLYNKML